MVVYCTGLYINILCVDNYLFGYRGFLGTIVDGNIGNWEYHSIPNNIIYSYILGFLVAFLSLFFGASVESIFYYRIMTYACILLFRLYWVRRQINFPFYDFLKSVILRSLLRLLYLML